MRWPSRASPATGVVFLGLMLLVGLMSRFSTAGLDTVDAPPTPLLVPLRLATEAPPSIPTNEPGRRHLRSRKGKPGPPEPDIQAATLFARPKIQWGYVSTMKLPGGQVVEVLPDTGSSQLWLPTTLCPACNQVILDRQHPDLKSIRPVVDVAKAQATFINCTSEQCVGKCSDELLERFGIKDKETFCSPHGGTCTGFLHPGDYKIQNACSFNASYGDGSTQLGALTRGPIEFGGLKLQDMTWGALVIGTTHTLFEPGGGGVMGLRPGICHESALSCYPSFLDTMAAETGLPRIVTFCGNEDRPLLVLGGGDARLHDGPVRYTPMKGRNDTYTVGVESATLGGVSLPVPDNSSAFVDTGTSLAYLPGPFVEALQQMLATPKYCEELGLPHLCPTAEDGRSIFDGKDDPLPFTAEHIAKFPALVLQLPNGPTLELQGEDYLQSSGETDPDTGMAYYSLAFKATKRPNMFLLGQLFLRKYYTEFDVQNGRLGFAPAVADCYKAVGL